MDRAGYSTLARREGVPDPVRWPEMAGTSVDGPRPPTGAFCRWTASGRPVTTTAPDGVAIRPAERADLLPVLRIEQASFPQPWPYQAFEGFLGEPGFLVAVGRGTGDDAEWTGTDDVGDTVGDGESDARSPGDRGAGSGVGGVADAGGLALGDAGDEVRGYVVADVVSEFGRTVGHVKDIAVHPGWRGRGIGTRLLDRALSVLAAGGARRAKLEVRAGNREAQKLYRSFGFSPDHVVSGYYDDGEDALLFVADLTERRVGGD